MSRDVQGKAMAALEDDMWGHELGGKGQSILETLFLELGASSMPNTPSSQLQLHPES
jgi:hypothetical protein